jgi:putative transposase
VQNAFIESFNGKFRDESLNQNWHTSLEDARRILEAWRMDYSTMTPVVSVTTVWEQTDVQHPRNANL